MVANPKYKKYEDDSDRGDGEHGRRERRWTMRYRIRFRRLIPYLPSSQCYLPLKGTSTEKTDIPRVGWHVLRVWPEAAMAPHSRARM